VLSKMREIFNSVAITVKGGCQIYSDVCVPTMYIAYHRFRAATFKEISLVLVWLCSASNVDMTT
jgi:hypothetical protein